MNRRGQVEIVGLLIIVVLVTAGFLIYVRYTLESEGSYAVEAHEGNQLGQTFVNTLASTVVNCSGTYTPASDIIRDLAAGAAPACDMEELEPVIVTVLDETLDEWGINYRLSVQLTDGTPVNAFPVYTNPNIPGERRCSDTMDRSLDYYLISLYPEPGQAELRLEQCRNT